MKRRFLVQIEIEVEVPTEKLPNPEYPDQKASDVLLDKAFDSIEEALDSFEGVEFAFHSTIELNPALDFTFSRIR